MFPLPNQALLLHVSAFSWQIFLHYLQVLLQSLLAALIYLSESEMCGHKLQNCNPFAFRNGHDTPKHDVMYDNKAIYLYKVHIITKLSPCIVLLRRDVPNLSSKCQFAISQLRIVPSGLHLVTYLDVGNLCDKSADTTLHEVYVQVYLDFLIPASRANPYR